jgi:hypothetical protein
MKEDVMKAQSEQQGQRLQVFSMSETHCVWMKTGVVNYKTCENGFDCTSCCFDKEISGKLAQKTSAPVSWKEVMQQQHLHKECRHMLTGRVLFKLCSHNYACNNCAYDQQLYEYDQVLREKDLPAVAAVRGNRVVGFTAPLAGTCGAM